MNLRKVNASTQELAIAHRIEVAQEVEIEDLYDTSGEGHVGLHTAPNNSGLVLAVPARQNSSVSVERSVWRRNVPVPQGDLMGQETDLINAFIQVVSDNAIPALKAMAAIGALAMAIIQTAKNLLPWRRWFQRRFVRRWLEKKARASQLSAMVSKAEEDLVKLATAGDRNALYDLPIERLCGQINAAAQTVLDFPRRHRDLLLFFAAQSDPADLELLLQGKVSPAEERSSDEVNARIRVANQVQRSIDGLQIAADHRWTLILQVTSFGLCFALTLIAMNVRVSSQIAGAHFNPSELGGYIRFFVVAIAAGFLAPVARDLVASLQKLRE